GVRAVSAARGGGMGWICDSGSGFRPEEPGSRSLLLRGRSPAPVGAPAPRRAPGGSRFRQQPILPASGRSRDRPRLGRRRPLVGTLLSPVLSPDPVLGS